MLSTPCVSLGELVGCCILAVFLGYGVFPIRIWLGELLWQWRVDRALDERDRRDRERMLRWNDTRATATPASYRRPR